MKRKLLLIFASITVAVVSILVCKANITNGEDSVFLANVEALMYEELPNGVIIECTDSFCIIFDYRKKWLVAGCKAQPGETCTVQKTELPDINFG